MSVVVSPHPVVAAPVGAAASPPPVAALPIGAASAACSSWPVAAPVSVVASPPPVVVAPVCHPRVAPGGAAAFSSPVAT